MPRSIGKRKRGESGQALVEAALLIPIVVVLLAGVFDMGRYYVLAADVQSACDSVCRMIEADQKVDIGALEGELDRLYPNMSGSLELHVGDAEMTNTSSSGDAGYHIYDPRTGSWKSHPQTTSQEKRAVTVTLEQNWVTPGMMALSAVTTGSGFKIERTNTATIDRTLEAW